MYFSSLVVQNFDTKINIILKQMNVGPKYIIFTLPDF